MTKRPDGLAVINNSTKRLADRSPNHKGVIHDRSELVDPLWERQPWETRKAYERFRAFRDMPNRELAKVATMFGVSADYIRTISPKNLWVERADAWDAHLDRIGIKTTEASVKHAAATTAQKIADLTAAEWEIWDAAKGRIVALLASGDPKDAQAAAQLIREANKVARLSTGMPTEGVKPGSGQDESRSSDLDAFLDSLVASDGGRPAAD
jgi:hypothetical protein